MTVLNEILWGQFDKSATNEKFYLKFLVLIDNNTLKVEKYIVQLSSFTVMKKGLFFLLFGATYLKLDL